MEDNIKCLYDLNSGEPLSKIHLGSKTYEMVDKKGRNWGDWDLCDVCAEDHEKKGWKCTKKDK